jgi:exonuclease SbcC
MNVSSSAINRKVRKVTLTNFQSHKLTTFYLENGLTIISGSNDNGKTACARALSWVLHNSPIEDVIRRQNNIQTKFCQVEIEFVDGAIIRRYKSKTLNKIEYKYPEEENFTAYQGFNNKYPDVVWEFLQYPPIFKNEKLGPIAYADQSKKHFLIDIPSGSLPEIISSIIGVDDLDKASKQINSLILEENKNIIFLEKRLEELTEKENEDFSTLDDDTKTYNILLQTYNEIEALENDADELQK